VFHKLTFKGVFSLVRSLDSYHVVTFGVVALALIAVVGGVVVVVLVSG